MAGTYCIFDSEFTTWEGAMAKGWNGNGQHRELIQIAATRVEPNKAWEELETFDVLIKPVLNPTLSDFASTLTGITQTRMEAEGLTTAEALARFAAFVGEAPCFSNGMDINVVAETCGLQSIVMPVDARSFHSLSGPLYEGLRQHFTFERRDYPSGRVHELAGLTPPTNMGGTHNALHDVWSLFATCEWLKQQGTDVLAGLLKA